jgi:ATP-dependent protease HslVU (ClpYQ) peptidase subunit
MTVIALRVKKEEIVIGSDTQTTCGYNTYKDSQGSIYKNSSKILIINDLVIGVAGAVKNNCLLSIFCKNHKPKLSTEDGILDFLVEFNDWAKSKDESSRLEDNQFLIVYGGKAFEVVDGYLVREVSNYTAIGSGMFLALGAMYFDKSVEEAIEVSKEFDAFCGGKTIIHKVALSVAENPI